MRSWAGRNFSQVLALALSVTSFLVIVVSGTLISRSIQKTELSELIRSMTTQAAIIDAQIDVKLFTNRNSAALHELAHRLAAPSDCRVTFLTSDGLVLGDSSVPLEMLSKLENHKDRPEVHDALMKGSGHSSRFSSTIHEDFLYVAVAVSHKEKYAGVVRLAFPLTELKKRQQAILTRIIWISFGALLLAIFVALMVARPLSRPLDEVSEEAKQLADRVQMTGRELSHDRAHLAAILSNMEEGVAAVNSAGRITAVNPALCAMFGIRADEAADKFFLEAIRQSRLNQLLQEVLHDSKPRVDEVHAYAPDERVFEARIAPLMQEGKPDGALLVLHDITRLRRLENVRRDFVANVSHELRTPLASIKGFAETLRGGALKDPKVAPEFLQSIEKHTDNMTALVEDLLDLTAIESGQRTPAQEKLSLHGLLTEVLNGLAPIAKKRNITIANQIGDGELNADPQQLKQVLANLIDNAIKFNQDGGTVTITSKQEAGRLNIYVADSGVGIPAQDLPRVFERFYRVDKARSRAMGGTGLGLAIVKHLVEINGGTVSVESSIGKGAVFTVSFPAA